MIIQYLGLTSFRLQSNGLSLLIDPADPKSGISLPRMQNDVVLYSQNEKAKTFSDKTFVIDCPGEYEVKGCFVYGVPVNHDTVGKAMYVIEVEGMRVAYLGILKQAKLTDDQLDKLAGVDILMVPVGGGESLDSKQAIDIVNQIEPRIVIPMYYQIPGLKLKLDSLDKFKNDSAYKTETLDKYKIAKKDLPQDETMMVVITPAK